METLQSIPQLDALRGDWNALADRAGHALLRHEWFVSAARTLHETDQLAVGLHASGSRLDAIAPLVRTQRGGTERLEFIGAEALHEPTGFLARDADARQRLCDEIVRQRRPVILQRMAQPADAADLRTASSGRGVLIMKATAPSLGLDLPGDGSEPPQSGKLRYDLKRARGRADAAGRVSVDISSPGVAGADAALDTFAAVEGSGWKGRRGSSLAANPRLAAFFRMYCRLAAEAGTLRCFVLRVNDEAIAAQIAVALYERLWVLKIGYDERWAACSPGFLLTRDAIGWACRQRLRAYEFLGSAEPWQERWRPAPRTCSLAAFYPFTMRSGVSASLDVANAVWRRLRPQAGRAS